MKQKKFLFLFLLALTLVGCEQKKTTDQQVEKKINELISKMSLEEKVGQMAQFTIDVFPDFTNACTPRSNFAVMGA